MLDNQDNQTNTLILLEGLYNSLIRNKVDLTEDIDCDILDKALSIKDQATLLCLNEKIKLHTYVLNPTYYSLLSCKNKDYINKLKQSIEPLAEMEETKASIYDALYEELLPFKTPPYKIITYRKRVVIVLYDGAFRHLDDTNNLLKFLLAYFKELKKITDLEYIANHPLFKLYIDKL